MLRTVLIVDDHAGFRATARAVLEDAGYVVVAEATDGPAAIAAARVLRPDWVLLDVQLPELDGFAVASTLATEEDPPAIVLTSSRDAGDFESLLQQAPVRGFLPKELLSARALMELLR